MSIDKFWLFNIIDNFLFKSKKNLKLQKKNMKKVKILFSIFLLLIFGISLNAQVVKGKIVDASNNEGVPGVRVFIVGANYGTVTNLDGTFDFKVPAGESTLKAQAVGFLDFEKNIDVEPGATLDLGTIKMQVNSIGIEQVEVVASYAQERKTPVSVSTINPVYISEKLGNQEFPEILKTTPSVYATKQGGGYGDSRINIRGFSDLNVGVLINGVPVNDMETGHVYWSNWMSLSDVTRSIQVQRGLGASRLAIPSVGGTINIITKTTDMKRGGSVFYGIGNNGYNKLAFTVSTGMTDNNWAVTVSGSHTTGNGYIEATQFEGWSYFLNVAKRFKENSQISFTMFGAPQWHNQNGYQKFIEAYRNDPMGRKLNWNYGYLNGKQINTRYNYYHKPVMSLNHFWKINSVLQLNTAVYASFGRGGGRRVTGPNAAWLKFTGPGNTPSESTLLTPEGRLDLDSVAYLNAHSLTGSKAVLVNSTNSHDWYGILSTLRAEMGKLTITGGYDGRYYKGYHNQKIYNLLGGKYYLDAADVNRDPGTPLKVGDIVGYNSVGVVLWNSAFAQAEYSTDKFSAFANVSGSYTQYSRIDYFLYTPEQGQQSPWVNFLTYSFKAGANYNLTDKFNVFVNAGYFTKPPLFKFAFNGYSNVIVDSVRPEKVQALEGGLGYNSKYIKTNLYLYYTKWMDKSLQKHMADIVANILGLNAIHKGIEWTSKFKINRNLTLGSMVSLGDWRWQKDVIASLYDQDQNFLGDFAVYAKGLHVGNSAQTTAALSLEAYVLPGLKIGADWTYFDRLYADFAIEYRNNPDDRSDAWKMPSYNLLDISANYHFKLGKFNASLFGKVNNLLDTEYFSDAIDGLAHNPETSYVYYGFGRTWSLGLKIKF